MRRFTVCLAAGWMLLSGCSPAAGPTVVAPLDLPEIGSQFSVLHNGRIEGQVLWQGPQPKLPDYRAPLSPRAESGIPLGRQHFANARTPRIWQGEFLANAVVLLRGIDPRRSKPWDKPVVRVEMKDQRLLIQQGNAVCPYGFVQRGRAVEMVSRDAEFHSLQARGAAFFTIPFADPNVIRERTLTRRGVVELGSGSGSFWMAGFLFVDDHPYATCTDPAGRFVFEDVPDGTYQLVAWIPNWHEVERELDGDTWAVASIAYRPPIMVQQTVQVVAGECCRVSMTLTADHCERGGTIRLGPDGKPESGSDPWAKWNALVPLDPASFRDPKIQTASETNSPY